MSRRAAVTVVAVTLAVVVGCSSEDPPASLPSSAPPSTTEAPPTTSTAPTTPTTSTAPTTPTTATATGAPTVPAAAQQQTPDGAAAFVQHWFDTLEYSWAVMESAPIRALGECLTCIEFAETIDGVAGRGNHLEGNEVTVRNLSPNAVLADGSTSVVALFDAPSQSEVDPQGVIVQVIEGAVSNIQYLFALARASETWTVASIRLIQ